MEDKPAVVGKIEFSEKLPDNWRGLYEGYKHDSARYAKALMQVRAVARYQNNQYIVDLVNAVLEGEDGP